MAGGACEHEEVPEGVEPGYALREVENRARGVGDAACDEEAERCGRKGGLERLDCDNDDPAHRNVAERRKDAEAIYEKNLEDGATERKRPFERENRPSECAAERGEAKGGIGARNEDVDRGVVEHLKALFRDGIVCRVVDGRGGEEQNERGAENRIGGDGERRAAFYGRRHEDPGGQGRKQGANAVTRGIGELFGPGVAPFIRRRKSGCIGHEVLRFCPCRHTNPPRVARVALYGAAATADDEEAMNLLSALSLFATAAYLGSGIKVLIINRRAHINQLAFALDLDLALWAFAAAFIYGARSPEEALPWQLAFAPTWHLCFALAFHFCALIAALPAPPHLRVPRILAIYTPAILMTWLSNSYRFTGFVHRGGYWMPTYRGDWSYWLFFAYYAVYVAGGLALLLRARARSVDALKRRRFSIIAASFAAPVLLGFGTDTLAPALGVDVPNLGILWILIWALGMRVAMTRYGFFAPLHEEIERRVAAESRLADMGRLFDAFMEHSLDGIAITDGKGKLVAWSCSMERVTGLAAAEALGRPVWEVQAEFADVPDRAALSRMLEAEVRSALSGEHRPWGSRLSEYRILDRAGVGKYLQSATFVIPLSAGGDIIAAIVRDVTAEKRAEAARMEELRRLDDAQRFEAVGTLAAGLAHDFNNILTGVRGTVSLLRLGIEDKSYVRAEELSGGLGLVDASAARAVELARQLLDIARRHASGARPVVLADAVRRAAKLTQNSLDPSVTLDIGPLDEEAVALAEGAEVERMVINLLLNAGEAMTSMRAPGEARGGSVCVSLRRAEACLLRATEAGGDAISGFWCISVRDEGVGISEDVARRIFDPFFTTKENGKSSGLGLSIVYNIAKRRGGFVEVDSRPGAGAEFRVYLPACPR